MKIICNKEEFAQLVINCTRTMDAENGCQDCALNNLCPLDSYSGGLEPPAVRLASICEIETECKLGKANE